MNAAGEIGSSGDNKADSSQKYPPKYVQDNLRKYKHQVVTLLCDRDAVLYVCGDARGMARNVSETLVEILQECRGITFINIYLLFK